MLVGRTCWTSRAWSVAVDGRILFFFFPEECCCSAPQLMIFRGLLFYFCVCVWAVIWWIDCDTHCAGPFFCFSDDVMEHIDGAVKVSEITELLRAEYGIVTGKAYITSRVSTWICLDTCHTLTILWCLSVYCFMISLPYLVMKRLVYQPTPFSLFFFPAVVMNSLFGSFIYLLYS